ncbi:hybrid sensor histidine kinase/response regulator [Noviherbaspirillum malthae]|uniref:hybrid sensor histidine kinase/response regulator n=1 Tax=Noviherbaspirillum malthae TaxID=1260987 RepID=UPI001E31CE1A|nr:ATP-binding protein [Noviherbaspirillum malthae]
MGAIFRGFDWDSSPLGAIDAWPQSLRTAVGMLLNARHPMYIAWGPKLLLLYNDGYRGILGAKAADPRQVLGIPFREVWAEVWEVVGPMLAAAMDGQTLWFEDQEFTLTRNGYAEQVFASFSTSPIRAETGEIAGVLCICSETTGKIRSQQERLRLLDAIGEATRLADDPETIMDYSTRLLGEYLNVTRVAYADLEPDNDRFTIRHDWRVPGAISTVGVYSLNLFGSRATSNLRVGRTLLINDVDHELSAEDGADMFNQIGIKAIICCPLVKQNRLVAMMAVHQQHPRNWAPDEVALVEAVVDRCWAHIERVRSMEALREVDRRRSEFLATLAHELRNPLAPIRNALQLLRLSSDKPEMLERLRGTMERQVDQMVHLINDLLDIARISSGKMDLQIRRIDLQTVVANAVETSLPLIEAGGHQLDLDLPADPIWGNGDAVRLSQVLTNLLSNASKYTPESGRISVSARTSGDMAVIEVSDTGIGIAEQDLGRVFDMFSQTSHSIAISKGGLGIGLSLVRHLVSLHGGTVNASSAGRGHGSTFTIRLPLAPDAAEEPSRLSAGAPVVYPSGHPRLKILVADDNVDAAETLSFLLREEGHEVCVAYDGEEAVRIGKSFVPDVAILDLGMPRMDGYQVARVLCALPELEHVSLVALSGWGAPEDQARTKAAGFDYHLLKPASLERLNAVLATLLRVQDEKR